MGRPPKTDPRDRQLNLSLTMGELKSIERRAEALGMRTVHFSRALLLDERRTLSTLRPALSQPARLLHHQLVRLGNNLNQLVRHLHQTNDPLPPDLEPLLVDIRQAIARLAP